MSSDQQKTKNKLTVKIAGYNIDKTLIDSLNLPGQATPETISAAYARISRSSKSVTELREESIREVAKARQSNERIIFDMGHSSIAEHAVFNFDVIGISRYLTEFVQKSRLASFTEKSQRYVTWKSEYVIPSELINTPLESEFVTTIGRLFELYQTLYSQAKEYYKKNEPVLSEKKIDEMAKEDARYVLPLATGTQMGMTLNTRSLENLLRRLANLDLTEAKELYDSLISGVKEITPSLIRYIEVDLYKKNLHNIPDSLSGLKPDMEREFPLQTKIDVIGDDPEERILAGTIFQHYPQDFDTLLKQISDLTEKQKEGMFCSLFRNMQPYHQAPKAFEMVDCIVQTSISASCFAQLKRHRIATILRSDYKPEYGFVIPEIFIKSGSDKIIKETLNSLSPLYEELESLKKGLGSYILTNAHRLNLIFKTNLRELYHFSRLRSDIHAQWEIRELSLRVDQEMKKLLPNAAKMMMGKDSFSNVKSL